MKRCTLQKLEGEIYVTEMWTTATSVPKQGCPPLVLDKVLRSEDSETLTLDGG